MTAFVNVEYQIPSRMLIGKDSVRITFDARSGNVAGGVYYLRLLSGTNLTMPKPYQFSAKEWGVCDVNRAPLAAFTYDSIANSFTIKKSGLNNLCFRIMPSKTDYYNITNSKIYFLIKGKFLKTGSSDSYIWWFNGYNNGSSIPPSTIVNGSNSVTYLLWHIPSQTALNYFMDFTQPFITLTSKGTGYVQAIGLTTSAADYVSTFSDVNYYSAEEAAAKYPEVATALGIPTSLKHVKLALDGITVISGGNGELLLTAHRQQMVHIYDVLGRPITTFVLEKGQNRTLNLRPGFYLVNGRKVLIN